MAYNYETILGCDDLETDLALLHGVLITDYGAAKAAEDTHVMVLISRAEMCVRRILWGLTS